MSPTIAVALNNSWRIAVVRTLSRHLNRLERMEGVAILAPRIPNASSSPCPHDASKIAKFAY